MPEKGARLVHAPFLYEPPNARAADDEVLVTDRVDLLGAEPVPGAEAAKNAERTRSLVPEQEVGADPDLSDVEPLDQHGPDECLGIPQRQLAREPDDRDSLHASAPERLELLRSRHEQRWRLVGPQHARRMRIERHRGGRAGTFAGAAPHAIDDLHVPAMQTVEVAQRNDGLMPAERRVFREMGDRHAGFDRRTRALALASGIMSTPPRAHHRPAPSPAAGLQKSSRGANRARCA